MTTVVPGLPLPLRNGLATVVIAALEEGSAREALAWLADPRGPAAESIRRVLADAHLIGDDGTLLPIHAAHASRIHAHARRGLAAALAHVAPSPPASPVDRAIAHAVALWNARLFFEVHEVLEAVWTKAEGPLRQALQGLIQIAVAFHHHAHGNLRGARTLMTEGRARLAAQPHALAHLDAAALLADTTVWEAGLLDGTLADDAGAPALRPTSAA